MCQPKQRPEGCVETISKIGDGANARAKNIKRHRFTSFQGVVSDFTLFIVLGEPATRQLDGWTLRRREAESGAAARRRIMWLKSDDEKRRRATKKEIKVTDSVAVLLLHGHSRALVSLSAGCPPGPSPPRIFVGKACE